MIDLAQIVEKIDARLRDIGKTASEVSASATGSKDTIRNWERAVEADRQNGTNKASATTIKLNQIEMALGVELTRNGSGATPDIQLRSALLAFGVDAADLGRAISAVKVFVDDLGEQSSEALPDDQSAPANRRREPEPSR